MERKRFAIPQVTDKTTKKEDINSTPKQMIDKNEKFVSPLYGNKAKDVDYFPTSDLKNSKKRYDFLRNGSKVSDSEIKDYCIPKDELGMNKTFCVDENPMNNYYDEEKEQISNEYLSNSQDKRVNDYNALEERNEKVVNEIKYSDDEYQNKNDLKNINNDYFKDLSNNDDEDDDFSTPLDYEKVQSFEKDDKELERDTNKVVTEIKTSSGKTKKRMKYVFPPYNLLARRNPNATSSNAGVQENIEIINRTLNEFRIAGQVVDYLKGPTVTLYEIKLEPGVKYQKINDIELNLKGNLAALAIRIQSPIPGKSTAGIEVPNKEREMVFLGDMLQDPDYMKDKNPMKLVIGKNITGEPQYVDITKMPHALIGGATRMGKSVCINSIIVSLIYRAHPDDVKLILIDPKKVEFSKFAGIPHLATPIIDDPQLAISALRWLVDEMENRYMLFSGLGVSNYQEYLDLERNSVDTKHIPYIVLIIDEFYDLIKTGGKDVEGLVGRLTAKARAAGIHLIVATQRPTTDVISGTIKANLPTRIAFKVKDVLNSNVILDERGAESLLGNGDMIYIDELGVVRRMQGPYVSGDEIKKVSDYVRNDNSSFLFTKEDLKKKSSNDDEDDVTNDELFEDVVRYVVQTQNASINRLQGKFHLSFNRAQAIIEKCAELGIVSENLGSRARTVLIEPEDLDDFLNKMD